MTNFKISILLFFIFTSFCLAHPIPDILVKSNLENKILYIRIELDFRCIEEDPEHSPYMLYKDVSKWSEISRNTAFELAKNYVNERIQLVFNQNPIENLEYKFRFMKLGGGELEKPDDVVVMALEIKRDIKTNGQYFSVKSLLNNSLTVEVIHQIKGKAIPRQVSLFPGEKSFDWALQI